MIPLRSWLNNTLVPSQYCSMVIKALMVIHPQYFSVEFSPSADWVIGGCGGGGGLEGRFSRYPLPVFSAGDPGEQFWHGQGVHSLMLSIMHFLCRPRRRPPSKVPWRMVLERLSRRETCPNHANLCLSTKDNTAPCH